MLKFLFFKERRLQNLFYTYLENMGEIQKEFMKAMNTCLEDGLCDDFLFLADRTHKYEARGDDIREEINLLMYSKALIPDYREDIMWLLETVDIIPRKFELILNIIRTQKLQIPHFIVTDLKELIQVSMECCDLMTRLIHFMLKRQKGVRAILVEIDQRESHCDHIERRMISRIFESELDPFLKLQLKEMVLVMGDISDQADRVSKRVNIMILKRQV